tara:strand:- start:852 stop:1157 length:306 start_codon:yes stop_codon:yes gene_type:complete
MSEDGKLQDYSVDQVAGAFVLVLSAISSLLLVLWQSKCLCKINFCWIFQCERRPPNEEEMNSLKEQYDKTKDKNKDKTKNKTKDKEEEEEEENNEEENIIP